MTATLHSISMEARAEEAANDLLGTCAPLKTYISEADRNNPKFMELVWEIVDECATCGWWHETMELNENGDCEDCAEAFG